MPIFEIGNHSFDVDASIIEGILESEAETSADGKEHGFLMCQTPSGVITKGKKCHGDACSIQLTDCKGIGTTAGSFHSHPTVISFSLGDYLAAVARAKEHPQNTSLDCVSLLDKGIRCKALKQMPPDALLAKLVMMADTDESRSKIKPFFTEKVTISNDALEQLLAGTKWSDLPASTDIEAVDEGPNHPQDKEETPESVMMELIGGMIGGGGGGKQSALMQAAANYEKPPTGVYPWSSKQVTASVAGPMGVGLVSKGMPELVSEETQWVKTTDIEVPDPSLIHTGEVAGYIKALSPIIMTQQKNPDGTMKILDGRHRVAAWRASGYLQIPVVYSKETEYKD